MCVTEQQVNTSELNFKSILYDVCGMYSRFSISKKYYDILTERVLVLGNPAKVRHRHAPFMSAPPCSFAYPCWEGPHPPSNHICIWKQRWKYVHEWMEGRGGLCEDYVWSYHLTLFEFQSSTLPLHFLPQI